MSGKTLGTFLVTLPHTVIDLFNLNPRPCLADFESNAG